MSNSTGTRKQRDVQTRANESITEADKEFINSLKIFSESSNSVAGLAGPAINNSPKTPAGNYLAREGDSMIGPLALGPPLDFTIDVDASNTINISPFNENVQYSSNIQLDDSQSLSAVLDIIEGAAFDGQILILRTFAPSVAYTISQGTIGNSGNIQTGDSNDLTVGDLQTVMLIFDEALVINANTGGTWRVMSISDSTSGGFSFPILWPKESLTPAASTTQTIDVSTSDGQAKQIQFPAGNISLQIIGDPVVTVGEEIHVMFIQDSVGGRSLVSVDSAIKNGSNMDLLLDKAANAKTMFKLVTLDAGVSYHAILVDLTTLTGGYTTIQDEGSSVTQRTTMNFIGPNVTVVDNPGLGRTDITISTGSGALSTLTIDITKSWLDFGIFDLQFVESNAANNPGDGFIRMGTAEEIRMRNPGNTDDLIITSGNDALTNQAILFKVASGNQLTISGFDIDVVNNDIVNTGDIVPGAGAHQVGDSTDFYNQMHSQFFVPEGATIITNRYGLAKTGNQLYVNFNDVDADAGFGIFEEGIQQFNFSKLFGDTYEFFIGSDPFTSGEEYRIQMGENSNSSARIFFIEGIGNDLILDRGGGSTDQGVQVRVGGLSAQRWLSQEMKIFKDFNTNSQDIFNTQLIKADTSGLATIGETVTFNGGFDYYLRDKIFWAGDPDTFIGMDGDGIDIVSDDGILISAAGVSDSFTIASVPPINVIVQSSTGITFTIVSGFPVATIQDNGLVMQEQIFMQSNKIANMADPTENQDAATKFYVDNFIGGGGGGNIFATAVKGVDETVNNSIALQLDDELKFTVNKNKAYFVEFNLRFTSSQSADLKVGLQIPSGATYRIAFGSATGLWSASTGTSGGQTLTFGGFGTTTPVVANFFVVVYTGSSSGTVGLLWAQNNTDNTDTTVDSASLLRAYEEGAGSGGGEITDILIGTENAENPDNFDDSSHLIFGNDNGENALGIAIGNTEPASFTFSYTLTASDFPEGMIGFSFNLLSIFFSLQCVTTIAAGNDTLNAKLFLNNVEIDDDSQFLNVNSGHSNIFGTIIGGENNAQVGDTIAFKIWANTATTFTLEKSAIYVYPWEIQMTGSNSMIILLEDSGELLGEVPSVITTTSGFQAAAFPEYSMGLANAFFSYGYGDGGPRMIFGEFAQAQESTDFRIQPRNDDKFFIPALEWIFNYRLVS